MNLPRPSLEKSKLVVGIDPGLKGGLAAVQGRQVTRLLPMPKDESTLCVRRLQAWFQEVNPDRVIIENLIFAGVAGAKQIFTTAKNYGRICAVLELMSIPYAEVSPNTWQPAVGSRAGFGSAKDRAFAIACALFPETNFILPKCQVPHDGLIDASLIAFFGTHISDESFHTLSERKKR